jgi:predicted deacetylase
VTAAQGRLLASIHDVSPRFEAQVDRLADLLAARLGGPRLAMLVIPDHWDTAPIAPGTPFATKLRRWHESGVEIVLHGWNHRDDQPHRGLAALRGRHMTAGEGEFLGLDEAEATRRLVRGRTLLEDIVGGAIDAFVAPAWLYSAAARRSLAALGFRIAEDHWHVWSPAEDGRALARGPVITWASRSRARRLSSLAAAGVLRHALKATRTVRIAVHPGDLRSQALVRSIEATLDAFPDHRPARYADLLVRDDITAGQSG